MHRRAFLKLLGVSGGIAAATSAGIAKAASAVSIVPNPETIGVLHDVTLCIGCRRCEEACARVNDRPAPDTPFDDLSVLDKRRRPTVNSYTVVNRYLPEGESAPLFRKTQCNHCLEPACASACFVKALIRNPDGSVTYDPSLCVGCRYCMIACPFSIPSYSYNRALNPLIHKCTLCEPRLLEGKLPGCVETCPTEALLFGKRADLLFLARKRIMKNPRKYVRRIYGETEMGGTSWLYLSPVPHEQVGQPVLGATSVPALTSGALGAVALVPALFPVLLGGAYAITKRKEKIAAEEQAKAVADALQNAEEQAAAAMRNALAKAAKDKENALAAAAKTQEAAMKAKEEEMAAALDGLKTEMEAKLAAKTTPPPAKKAAARKTASQKTAAKAPGGQSEPSGSSPEKSSDKEDS